MFFHSPNFAANESYNMGHAYSGDNRITFSIFGNNGHIYINDNIDLSLVRKKRVNSLNMVNNIPLYTLINDDTIPNDTSVVHQIYYLFYDNLPSSITANTPYTELCHLDIIMENERKKVDTTSPETVAVSDSDFATLGYNDAIIDFSEFASMNVWIRKSYRHTNRNIITRGKIKSSGVIGNKKYESFDKKIFMVLVDKNQINDLPTNVLTYNKFAWFQTVRFFARPDLLSVFLGALVDISSGFLNVQNAVLNCGGFAFSDASSHPSNLHVNGDAFDTNYFVNTDDNFAFISAIHKYGVGQFKVGIQSSLTPLFNQVVAAGFSTLSRDTDHDTHLHIQSIKILFRSK